MAKIRILKASPIYQTCINKIYKTAPGLEDTPYKEQYQVIMEYALGWADFWKKNLERTGSYEVEEVVMNAESLQKRWAQENNIVYSRDGWPLEILESQIAAFRPDVLFAHDYGLITSEFRLRMKRSYPQIKLIIGWDGIVINDANKFAGVDLMLSCVDITANYYKANGFESILLPFGFEESILQRLNSSGQDITALSFVGGISLFNGGHFERLNLLYRIAKTFDMELWISGGCSIRQVVKNLIQANISEAWRYSSAMCNFKWLLNRSNGEAFGIQMYQILANSKITFNSHIDLAYGKAANMRLFEATGVGTCLLTDWKKNLSDYFEPDYEVVTYRSVAEATDKIRYLLANEGERLKIAQAGQKRTLANHTFAHRGRILDETIRKMVI